MRDMAADGANGPESVGRHSFEEKRRRENPALFLCEGNGMRENTSKKVELLAPAGAMEAFRGAMNAGADAVYLAGQQFGARAYAGNFTEEELGEVLERAHLFGVRVYLTVNTLTRQSELPLLTAFVQRLAGKGLDGVIVQDLGVSAAIRRSCPEVELHASTQMSVTGREAVRFLKEQGFVRVVPARELSLEEIRLLKQEDVEVETFIHGAMCYSYSGRCLMSSFLGGRSGNRGRCAGTCRLPYEVLDENGKPAGRDGVCYPISMKDMCAIQILPDLIDCGIDSFKIEGRMKKPEYVAGTVAIYRKYIDRFYEWDQEGRPGTWQVDREDLDALNSLYIRSDLCSGYYRERNGRNMVTIHEPGYRGASQEFLDRIREQYLQKDRKLSVCGEAFLCAGKASRMTVSCGEAVYTAEGPVAQEARNCALTEEGIRTKLSKAGDSSFLFESLGVQTDGRAFLPVSALGELRRKALEGLAKELLKKRGQEERIWQDAGSGAELMQKAENEVEMQQGVGNTAEPQQIPEKEAEPPAENPLKRRPLPPTFYMVRTAEQAGEVLAFLEKQPDSHNGRYQEQRLEIASEAFCGGKEREESGIGPDGKARKLSIALILDGGLLEENAAARKERECLLRLARERDIPVLAALPYIFRESDRTWLLRFYEENAENFYGYVTRNLEEVEFLREKEYDKTVLADSMLYVWNEESEKILGRFCQGMVLPQELDQREMAETFRNRLSDKILMVYGRVPLMITAGCVRKTERKCLRAGKWIAGEGRKAGLECWFLKDRTGARFPVTTVCSHCQNIIYNSVPTSLHRFTGDVLSDQCGAVLFSFTTECAGEVREILSLFARGKERIRRIPGAVPRREEKNPCGRQAGNMALCAEPEYTNGHYRKGAI